VVTSSIFFSMGSSFLRFLRIVSAANLLHSTAARMVKPARLKAQVKAEPAREK